MVHDSPGTDTPNTDGVKYESAQIEIRMGSSIYLADINLD